MTRSVMNNLYKDLTETGIAFDECCYRILNQYYGSGYDFACHGILEDFENDTITDERLAGVLTLAKKKRAYLLINPEAREIEVIECGKRVMKKLRDNEMVATFIQTGIFTTFAESYAKTDAMLKQHFLHYQEDTSILELELMLDRTANQLQMWTLSGDAYNSFKLEGMFSPVAGGSIIRRAGANAQKRNKQVCEQLRRARKRRNDVPRRRMSEAYLLEMKQEQNRIKRGNSYDKKSNGQLMQGAG